MPSKNDDPELVWRIVKDKPLGRSYVHCKQCLNYRVIADAIAYAFSSSTVPLFKPLVQKKTLAIAFVKFVAFVIRHIMCQVLWDERNEI